jgi:hypothetical protein
MGDSGHINDLFKWKPDVCDDLFFLGKLKLEAIVSVA